MEQILRYGGKDKEKEKMRYEWIDVFLPKMSHIGTKNTLADLSDKELDFIRSLCSCKLISIALHDLKLYYGAKTVWYFKKSDDNSWVKSEYHDPYAEQFTLGELINGWDEINNGCNEWEWIEDVMKIYKDFIDFGLRKQVEILMVDDTLINKTLIIDGTKRITSLCLADKLDKFVNKRKRPINILILKSMFARYFFPYDFLRIDMDIGGE